MKEHEACVSKPKSKEQTYKDRIEELEVALAEEKKKNADLQKVCCWYNVCDGITDYCFVCEKELETLKQSANTDWKKAELIFVIIIIIIYSLLIIFNHTHNGSCWTVGIIWGLYYP